MRVDWSKNFFELFGLPVQFDVDLADLLSRNRELQRQVHPDRFVSASAEERRLSMQLTTLVNEAYQTLRDPVRRARYLLELSGLKLDDETDTSMKPEFLMEQMELREALEEARAREDGLRRLAELANDIERRHAAKVDELRDCFGGGRETIAAARNAVRELQFLGKLLQEIREQEAELT